ncbi:MAG: hypothetical protein PSX81_02635 [bacterium]|nr:hypothetical protein [bacterium]
MSLIINSDEIIDKCLTEEVLLHYNYNIIRHGKELWCKCPSCGKVPAKGKKAFQLFTKKNKQSGKCFSCGYSADAYALVKFLGNLSETKDHPEILKILADVSKVEIKYEIVTAAPTKTTKDKAIEISNNKKLFTTTHFVQPGSFAEEDLVKSGLTAEDFLTKVTTVIDGISTTVEIFRARSASKDGKYIIPGDDLVFIYQGLDGNIMEYQLKDKKGNYMGKPIELSRVRYQHPEHHQATNGKSMKYASPYGSGSQLWWPNKLIEMYQSGTQFDTLYIQEGEKKAEKATKAGMLSVGIMGIANIMGANKQLHPDFALIIKKCKIRNIVFVVDADWNILKYEPSNEPSNMVNSRALTFFSATNNVKAYFHALINNNIDVNVHFSYILPNENKDKGMDDLLANTLKGKESDLLAEYAMLLNTPHGSGTYVNTHNISVMSASKLQEIFKIGTKDQFVEANFNYLKELEKFNYNGTWLKIDDNCKDVMAQALAPEEEFYKISYNKKGEIVIKWMPSKFHKYLVNNGTGQYIISKQQSAVNECLIKCNADLKTVTKIRPKDLRFDILRFFENIGEYDMYDFCVNNEKYLSDNSFINNIKYINDQVNLVENTPTSQNTYFNNCYWHVTKSGIESKNLADLNGYIWQQQVKDFAPKLGKEPLVRFVKIDEYNYKPIFRDDFKKADFLQFLINTGNDYRTIPFEKLTPEQLQKVWNNLANKLSGIGYATHRHFNPSIAKAIVATDSNDASEGESHGRTGKSLLGQLFKNICTTWEIDGKKPDIDTDKNLYGDVDENTELVYYDDTRKGWDFESVLSRITGNFKIRQMYKAEIHLPREKTPKFFITTNHIIKGYLNSPSFRDRINYIPFSNFYNENWKPSNDFKNLFFDEWDWEQWNLCYEMVACSQQIYFENGLIQGNMDLVSQKSLYTEISETIVKWFDEFFIDGKDNTILRDEGKTVHRLNLEIDKSIILTKFESENRKYVNQFGMTSTKFKQKIKQWCVFHGFKFNPKVPLKDKTGEILSEYGGDDKRSGKEYITIGSSIAKEDSYSEIFNPDLIEFDANVLKVNEMTPWNSL